MYHPSISQDKWNKFSTIEQLANIGSEVSRAINWKERDSETMRMAVYRALELIDLTIIDKKNRDSLKEILRIRECIVDFFLGDNVYHFTEIWWQKYFLEYAIAVRRNT